MSTVSRYSERFMATPQRQDAVSLRSRPGATIVHSCAFIRRLSRQRPGAGSMAGMHQPSDFQVFRTLDRTSNARLLRSSTLSDGLALAHWYRDEAEILGYSDPGHHTLSLYLQGGWQTFRRDRPGLYGGPDRFCVMPAEHHSDWAVTRGLGFMHLYISPNAWPARRYAPSIANHAACNWRSAPTSRTSRWPPCAGPWNDRTGTNPASACYAPASPTRRWTTCCSPGAAGVPTYAGRAGWPRTCGGASADYIESHLSSRWNWGRWRSWRRSPSTTSRACSASPSACRRTATCWNDAWRGPATCWRTPRSVAPGGLAGLRLRQSEPFQPALPRSPWRHPGAVPRRPESLLKARRRQPAVVGRHSRSIK